MVPGLYKLMISKYFDILKYKFPELKTKESSILLLLRHRAAEQHDDFDDSMRRR